MSINKIKVLQIIENLNRYGGTPNKLLLISKYLDKSKYEIFIAYFSDDDTLRNEFQKNGIHVIKISKGLFKAVIDTYKIIKKKKITIISTHFNRSHIIGTICALLTGKILIQNEHGLPRGYKAKKNILSKLGIYLFDKFTYRFKDAYIINSFTVMKQLQKDINTDTTKYFIVQNAIDVEKYILTNQGDVNPFRKYRSEKDKVLFGTMGGFIGLRDFITPIKAMSLISKQGIDTKLIICGDGPTKEKEKIEKEINNSGLLNKVICLGYCDNVKEFLSEIDVFIYPVLISAGLGLVLLEAMLMKKPIITFADGEKQERIIIDGVFGFNVKQYSEIELAEKMLYFIRKPDEIRRMGNNCSKFVLEYHTGERIARDICEIYNKIINVN